MVRRCRVGVDRYPPQRDFEVEIVVSTKSNFFFGLCQKCLSTIRPATTVYQRCLNCISYCTSTRLFLDITTNATNTTKKSIVELLKCIWVYSDSHGNHCKVCRLCKKWAIESLGKKRLPEYIDFHSLVYNFKKRNPRYEYIAHLPTGYSLYLRPLPRATTTSTTKTKANLLIAQHKVEKKSHNKFYNQTNNKYYFTKTSTATTKIRATTASDSMGYFY